MGTSAPPADSGNEDGLELRRLAEEHAALRRVATLVASGAPSADVFSAVAREVAQVMHLPAVAVFRYDGDGLMTVIATWSDRPYVLQPGTRWPLDGKTMVAQIQRTGRPARVEDYTDLPGALAARARESGPNATAGAPIIVDGSVWGAIGAASPDAPLPNHVEDRLAEFTELVATAIANSQAHEQLEQLADEQAALRRVATLVAAGAPPTEVFEAVSAEVAALIAADGAVLTRYEADGTVTAVSGWTIEGGYSNLGTSYALEGTVSGLIFETGRPGRVDNYAEAPGPAAEVARLMGIQSSVGAPITVEGRLWGALSVVSKSERPLPSDTEERLAEFAELFATAIANSEAREQLALLADEQAALRRVATLVAEGANPHRVFDAVQHEAARMFSTPVSMLMRYDDANGTATLVTTAEGFLGPVGRSWPVEGDSSATAQVCRTGLPARADYTRPTQGPIAAAARAAGGRSAVGVPVVVDGALWGVVTVGTRGTEPLPADVEGRLAKFTELVATAIANAEGRAELDASRARIVATADATRRRIERDLHDGAQQRLVSLAMHLRATVHASPPPETGELSAQMDLAADGLYEVVDELREIARGLHPTVLAEGGLRPALKGLARRSAVPVRLDIGVDGRLPEPIELAVYYVVAEALTNTVKHAHATVIDVQAAAGDGVLRVGVSDDGRGGADPTGGSGLVGLTDRVEALGGRLTFNSPSGGGTALQVVLPLPTDWGRSPKSPAWAEPSNPSSPARREEVDAAEHEEEPP